MAETDHHGIPGGDNRWFPGQGQARKAALREATRLGAHFAIVHDPCPSRGLPHYHVIDTVTRERVSGHFFYGRRPPRPVPRFQRRLRQSEAELEANLKQTDYMIQRLRRGQAGRYPWRNFASRLRQQGFLASQHFLDRFRERALALGIRLDPHHFGREFFRARHYRQTRVGYNTRIAMMRGLPILYRIGGRNGNKIVLVGALPQGALPPVEPVSPPRLREREKKDMISRTNTSVPYF